MSVLCTGSIAFDYILSFKGRFKDHILPDKTHILNLSFLVDNLKKRRGGVAGNYAYNLALLGYPSAVLATAGSDAVEYRAWLEKLGVDCRGLRLIEDEISATGFTTTDLDDNQITGYYGGAINLAGSLGLDSTVADPAAGNAGPERLAGTTRPGHRYLHPGGTQLLGPPAPTPPPSAAALDGVGQRARIAAGSSQIMPVRAQVELRSVVPPVRPDGDREEGRSIPGQIQPVGRDVLARRGADRVPSKLAEPIKRQVRRDVLDDLREKL